MEKGLPSAVAGFEDGGDRPSAFEVWEKPRNTFSLKSSQRKHSPANTYL